MFQFFLVNGFYCLSGPGLCFSTSPNSSVLQKWKSFESCIKFSCESWDTAKETETPLGFEPMD